MPGTPGVTWSYETLREISLRHAARLQALDVGAGDRVAMLLSRRPEAIALMLGAVCANAQETTSSGDLYQGLTRKIAFERMIPPHGLEITYDKTVVFQG